jgi:signal transduction histidine kinase
LAYRIVQEALTNVVRHAGMRERAALYGGTLEAGPLPGGGFRVAASLPVEDLS